MNQQIIQPLDKGQITIPIEFRKRLGIDKNTLLKVSLQKNSLIIEPLNVDWKEKYIREFTDGEIEQFVKDDKLDRKTVQKLKKLLNE